MHLTLLRHAERENSGVSNPPLSSKGLQQSEKLLQMLQNQQLPMPQKLFSSPKIRATMTLQKIKQVLNLELSVLADLDERSNAEAAQQFAKRVKNQLAQLSQMKQNTLVCSHLDWIEEALIHIPCDIDLLDEKYSHWGTASHMTFAVSEDLWYLEKWGRIEI